MLKLSGKLFAAASGVALLCAGVPAQAAEDEPMLGQIALAGLTSVCMPIIERGDNLASTARAEGFEELTGEDREAFGGGPGMSSWAQVIGDDVIVVARDLEEAGSPCRVAVSVPSERKGNVAEEIGAWALETDYPFTLVQTPEPEARNRRDLQWIWQRQRAGTFQKIWLIVTDHSDGSTSAAILYGLAPVIG